MGNHASAGIYTKEIDKSQRVRAVASSIGASVGASNKGPVNQRVLITSPGEFVDVFGAPDPRVSFLHYSALAFLEWSDRMYVTRVDNHALTAGAYLTVDDPTSTSPLLRLTNFDIAGTNTPQGVYDPLNTLGFNPTDPALNRNLGYFCAVNPGEWNNSLYIQIRPSNKLGVAQPDDPLNFYVEVFVNYKGPQQRPDERFLVRRSKKIDGFGQQMYIEEVINYQSKLIRYRDNVLCPEYPIFNRASVFLDGATNGQAVTSSMIVLGWELYQDVEQVDINIMINSGYTDPAIQIKMAQIAELRMDCIAVLDTPKNKQITADAVAYKLNDLNLNSSYAAIYTPDLLIKDAFNDIQLYVPPSGFAAAAYARTDKEAELWFSPAGMARGDLNILSVRHVYNQGMRDALNDAQVNMVRVFPGKGYKLWNDCTTQVAASALSNINVRRLLNFIEKSIGLASYSSVFDPNDSYLRAQLVEMAERFLRPIKAGRGLYWYSVQCNAENNPPEVVANGDLMLDIYIDPVLPAKRIHLTAIITPTGASYKEIATARTNAAG